jgi:DNA-binding transcriptional ArsR family regulator
MVNSAAGAAASGAKDTCFAPRLPDGDEYGNVQPILPMGIKLRSDCEHSQTMPKQTAILSPDIEKTLRSSIDYSPDLERLMQRARAASDFLKALSHESRLLLLCLIAERERSVTDLETILALRQPTVSQQLARLRMDELVKTRRDGKTMYYSLANDDVHRMIELIYDIFCRDKDVTGEEPSSES